MAIHGGLTAQSQLAAAIPDADAIIRALKPLELRRLGVMPALKRGVELDVIVDTSLTMAIWQQTVSSFEMLLTGIASFSDIRVTYLNSDDPDARVAPLRQSANRRLTIVLSDCVGRGWAKGSVLQSLEPLAEAAPLTIVHMLPQRLWAGCGLQFVPVQVGAHRCENSAVRLWADPRPGYLDMRGEGVAIPVLELDDRWLAPWASVIAGETRSPIAGMAVYSGSASDSEEYHGVVAPQSGVALFRSVATPNALRLASYLSAAPLSLPVLRLLQSMTLPGSRPVDLAEVLLSGLLRRVDQFQPGGLDFDFIDTGVRQVLLAALPRAEVLSVFRSVCQIVGDRFGASPAFTSFLANSAGAAWPKPDPDLNAFNLEPFASIAITVLRAVGGPYRDIAYQFASPSGKLSSSEAHATRLWQRAREDGCRIPQNGKYRLPGRRVRNV